MLSINPKVPVILAFIVGSAMVGAVTWQGYSFWQNENRQMVRAPHDGPRTLAEKPGAPAIPLASLDFFGAADANETETEENTENLPETNLKLVLRGVLAADGDFPGSALVEDGKNNTDVFLVGDELPGNATLHSVQPNRIILDRSGKLENLFFPEPDDYASTALSSRASRAPQSERNARNSAGSTQRDNGSQQQRREEIRKRLEQLRNRLRTNG
ncbi:general secretion pathway protein GspC [Marinobacter adhaerens]|uniref:General secretion pathway protein GspC n=1 Tax=Marinobacter adhaerens TaxID=1033846 RepID=A0A851HL13_9GAMM|nr:type II secretion system protein N [Marinobacter adhaerens]NWN90549.1 general secretion pathway protein GspC [Marinobacter adhaerens]